MTTRKKRPPTAKKKVQKKPTPPKLEAELEECLRLFADPRFTGNDDEEPVSRIIFSCQGEITTPPDFGCMGYGMGPSGEVFADTGTLDLTAFFASGITKKNFALAAKKVTAALEGLGTSKSFAAIPKSGPVIFALAIVDQFQQVLGRMHPDGRFELPPARKE